MEINQYPLESLTFQDNDFYDIDFWTGSGYQTKKILGSVIKAGILAAVENIYNADGSLNGNRSVDLDGNIVSFNSANAGEFNVLVSDSSTSTSTFNQSIAQIYLSIVDILTAGKNVAFDINTTNTQLVLNDGAGNSAALQISGVGSALNFSDGVTNYRVEANENGVVINTSYALPNTDGTAGQVMTTDGAGVVSWQPVSGQNIYTTDGTLIANRVISQNNFTLTFDGGTSAAGSNLFLNTSGSNRSKALNFQVGSGLRWKQRVSGVEIGGDDGSVLAFDYYSDAGVLKGTALQLNRTNGSVRLNNAYNLPTAAGTLGQVMRTNGSGTVTFQSLPVEIQVAASDEITPLTLGNGKVTFRMPHGMTLTEVRASLTTAQVSGAIFRIDVVQNGVSVLSTKCTIDNAERTSTTATTLPVIAISALADDAEMRVDITQVGDGTAKGLKVTLIGTRQ